MTTLTAFWLQLSNNLLACHRLQRLQGVAKPSPKRDFSLMFEVVYAGFCSLFLPVKKAQYET